MASLTATITNLSNFTFTPLQIPGCIVWFDSADSNTYSGSGTNSFQWRSKGINSLTASVNQTPGPTAATCNGYPCIFFSNSNTKLTTGTIPTLGATGTTWFAAGFNNCNQQPADAAVLIASVSPEKAIRWSFPATNVVVYALDASPLGSSNATSNGVRGFIETTSLFSVYQNGVFNCNTTVTTYQGGTNVSFVMGQWASSGLIGGINEIIIYNSPLSVTQYQQVEGYLAWKYGYNGFLPSTHPNFLAQPPVAGQPTNFLQRVNPNFTLTIPVRPFNTSFAINFNPRNVSNIQLWLDANDSTTMSFSNTSNVSQWRDKSGLGNHFYTQGGSPYLIIDGVRQGVRFTSASQDYMQTSNLLTFTQSNTFIFAVANQLTSNACAQMITFGAGNDWSLRSGNVNSLNNGDFFTSNSFWNNYSSNTPFIPYGPTGYFLIDGPINNQVWLYGSSSYATSFSSNLLLSMNNSPFAGRQWNGYINEIIIYSNAPTALQRQQIEYYLGAKWGLTSNVPATHAYFGTPTGVFSGNLTVPVARTIVMSGTNRWQPNALSGLALWLDAADQTTVQLSSGSNVSNWIDKSGNGRNGTANGTVFYANRAIGGLNTMSFTSVTNSYIRGNISITGTTFTCFAVATLNSTSKTDSRILSLGIVGANDFSSASYAAAIVRTGTTNTFYSYRNNNGTTSLSVTYSVPFLICALYDGTTKSLFINSVGTSNASVGTFNISNYQIGSSFTEEAILNYGGLIGEEIVYTTALSTADRQRVEGYLAWKWGLRASLPANHPYKIIPPS